MRWIPLALACWLGISVALAAGWARLHRRRPTPAPARPVWSQRAIDAEFARIAPYFTTPELFALDNTLNRRAGGVR